MRVHPFCWLFHQHAWRKVNEWKGHFITWYCPICYRHIRERTGS
jgi:hypothetical protein